MPQTHPYTQQQIDDFKAEFAKRRRRQIVLAVPVFILVIGGMMLRGRDVQLPAGMNENVVIAGFVALVAAALIFSFSNWRCPACSVYLGRSLGPHFCPRCGVELR